MADGQERTRFVWTAEVLPDAVAPYIDGQMDPGVAAIKKAFASR